MKNNIILIADSGSTKTDWTLLNPSDRDGNGVIATFHTQGITPIHQTPEQIRQIIGQELVQQLSSFPRARLIDSGVLETPLLSNLNIVFYGSGCTPVHAPHMRQLLMSVLSTQNVEVYSDLMGAARALCQQEEGIACILGTGANSCLYDGQAIVQNTPALGYILGDEGSGAALGCRFLNALYKGALSEEIKADFESSTGLTLTDVIERVYHEPMANRFLASLSEFIHRHLDDEAVRQLVIDNFRDFFRKNIVPYRRPDLPVSFVGSVAWHYQNELREAAAAEEFVVGTILQSPIEGLMSFHQ